MAKLTPEHHKQINKLNTDGKTPSEIGKIIGVDYINVYNHVNRVKRSEYQRNKRESKPTTIKISVPTKFVESSRPMPPVNKCKTIMDVVDRELAEKLLAKVENLKNPVCSLSQRPRQANVNGLTWTGSKWVPGVKVAVTGRLRHSGSGLQL